ncbi:AAA-like domain-containing protein [Geminocystis sp. CENA526]|uniref:AAA-like domain-containing protein n=1 Tax=Geminocystis sp. CENA526 TaxID=1355871 RepID=UPI003D6E040C
MLIDFPNTPVPLYSPFYINRPPLEENALREIERMGSLIRIKAPKQMGKTSLLIRILAHAKKKEYKTISIDFQEAEKNIFNNLNTFLRWFCVKIAKSLKLPPLLNNYWDEDIGAKTSATVYLEEYILTEINEPIVIALNKLHLIFEYPFIAQEFLSLLRFWYEQTKQVDIFEKLKLIIVHSTEIYVPLNINQSPFNVGFPIELPYFNSEQIYELAITHQLSFLLPKDIEKLRQFTGGHPYLIRLAYYHLYERKITLDKLLEEAKTPKGIYTDHLLNHWNNLKKNTELLIALKKIIKGGENTCLDSTIFYQLDSMGLVKCQGNHCEFSCDLYRDYFAQQSRDLKIRNNHNLIQVKQLQAENEALKELVNIDSLTKVASRRYFNEILQIEWNRNMRENSLLSLILLDVDYFKIYNDTYGHPMGDICLGKVADGIKKALKRSGDLVARYGGEEFAIILPKTNQIGAISVAENVRNTINSLQIEHINSQLNEKIVTVSLGIATIRPQKNTSVNILIDQADRALYEAKRRGRNQCYLDFQRI